MKTSYFFILALAIILNSCGKPIRFDEDAILGNNSRFMGPEGGKMEFVESYLDIDEIPASLVTLDFPEGSLNEETQINIIRGDFFTFQDLLYDERNGGVDTIINPIVFEINEDGQFFGNGELWLGFCLIC